MIRLEHVEKVYRTDRIETVALSNLSLEVAAGEFVSVMGPSGCGKSTLLNIIGLLDAPTAGVVHLDGAAVTRYRDRELAAVRNREIGFVFQGSNLLSRTSAIENVELPMLYGPPVPASERHRRAAAALESVGLGGRLDHHPNQLSGGQQQRVAIARALVSDPSVLVCDEPTGDLDRETSDAILGLLQLLNRTHGKTIIMVTHDPRAADHASRRLYVDKGVLGLAPLGAAA